MRGDAECCPPRFAKEELAIDEKELEAITSKFRALSSKIRVKILLLLKKYGKLCVCEIEQALGLKQPRVSYHLQVFLKAGLVSRRIEGANSYYHLKWEEVDGLFGLVGIRQCVLKAHEEVE